MKPTRTYDLTLGGVTRHVVITRVEDSGPLGAAYLVRVGDGPERTVYATSPVPDVLGLLLGDEAWECGLVETEDGFDVEVIGVRHPVSVQDPKRKALRMAGGAEGSVLKTAMPGRIVRVLVEPGRAVQKGEPLLVIEAMKMENEIKAPRDGVIKKILVKSGDLVEARATLVELEAA